MCEIVFQNQRRRHLIDVRAALRAGNALCDHQLVGLDARQTFIPENQGQTGSTLQRFGEPLHPQRLRTDFSIERQGQSDHDGIRLLLNDQDGYGGDIPLEAADTPQRSNRKRGGL